MATVPTVARHHHCEGSRSVVTAEPDVRSLTSFGWLLVIGYWLLIVILGDIQGVKYLAKYKVDV